MSIQKRLGLFIGEGLCLLGLNACGEYEGLIAQAELLVSQTTYTTGDIATFDASNSIYDSLEWQLNGASLNECEQQDVCQTTLDKHGTFEIRVIATVEAQENTQPSEASASEVLLVNQPTTVLSDANNSNPSPNLPSLIPTELPISTDTVTGTSTDTGTGTGTADNAAPAVTNALISISSFTPNSIDLQWTKATDNVSLETNLEYRVYSSATNNLSSVSSIESAGTPINSYEKDINQIQITSLSHLYEGLYFNIIVEDEAGNKNIYQPIASPQQIGGSIQRKTLALSNQVVTVIGNGLGAHLNSTGTAAQVNLPQGVTTDGTNLYIADSGNQRIRQVVIATGVTSTIAGGAVGGFGCSGSSLTCKDGTGSSAQFNNPTGITTNGTFLYVADSANHRIRQIQLSTGNVTTLAGNGAGSFQDGVGTAAQLNTPTSVTLLQGVVYIADTLNHRIRQLVISTGDVTTLAGGSTGGGNCGGNDLTCKDGVGTAAQFNQPTGITTDGTFLYVLDSLNFRIRKISIATGSVSTLAGNGSTSIFYSTGQLTTDGVYLYVVDSANHRIQRVTNSHGAITTLVGGGTGGGNCGGNDLTCKDGVGTAAQFNTPMGITTNGVQLFVTDRLNQRVRRIQ